jgi:hypothetical protein
VGAAIGNWSEVGVPDLAVTRYYPDTTTLAWQVFGEAYWNSEGSSTPTYPTLRAAAD